MTATIRRLPIVVLCCAAALIAVAFTSPGQSGASAPVPSGQASTTAPFASSPLIQSGAMNVTVTRMAADKIKVRVHVNVVMAQAARVGLTAHGCLRGIGAICNSVDRDRVYELPAGRHRLTWQTTLRAGPRLYATTVSFGTGYRATPEAFTNLTLS